MQFGFFLGLGAHRGGSSIESISLEIATPIQQDATGTLAVLTLEAPHEWSATPDTYLDAGTGVTLTATRATAQTANLTASSLAAYQYVPIGDTFPFTASFETDGGVPVNVSGRIAGLAESDARLHALFADVMSSGDAAIKEPTDTTQITNGAIPVGSYIRLSATAGAPPLMRAAKAMELVYDGEWRYSIEAPAAAAEVFAVSANTTFAIGEAYCRIYVVSADLIRAYYGSLTVDIDVSALATDGVMRAAIGRSTDGSRVMAYIQDGNLNVAVGTADASGEPQFRPRSWRVIGSIESDPTDPVDSYLTDQALVFCGLLDVRDGATGALAVFGSNESFDEWSAFALVKADLSSNAATMQTQIGLVANNLLMFGSLAPTFDESALTAAIAGSAVGDTISLTLETYVSEGEGDRAFTASKGTVT